MCFWLVSVFCDFKVAATSKGWKVLSAISPRTSNYFKTIEKKLQVSETQNWNVIWFLWDSTLQIIYSRNTLFSKYCSWPSFCLKNILVCKYLWECKTGGGALQVWGLVAPLFDHRLLHLMRKDGMEKSLHIYSGPQKKLLLEFLLIVCLCPSSAACFRQNEKQTAGGE